MASQPKVSPYVTQAQQAANLKYGPLVQALGVLQQTANSQYTQGRTQADSAAKSIIAAADSAKGGLGDMLTRVGGYSGDTANRLGITSSSPLAGEAATQAANLGLSGQAAMAQLQNAKVRGAEAGVYQAGKARDQYLSDTGKIQDQYTALQGQSGDFASSELNKLLQAAGQRQLDYTRIRHSDANAQAGRDNALTIAQGNNATSTANTQTNAQARIDAAKGSRSGTGAKLLPITTQKNDATLLGSAVASLKTLDPNKTSRAHTAPLLVDGHASTPILDPLTGKPKLVTSRDGKTAQALSTPSVPKAGQLLATAAADMYYEGHVSKTTQKALQDAGYSIKSLGLVSAGEYAAAHPPVSLASRPSIPSGQRPT